HMKQCKAPCCGKIDKVEYQKNIQEITSLLSGQAEQTIEKMTAQMKAASADLDFEKAARLRDGIKALMILQNQNIVESFDAEDCDYIAHYSEGELVSFTVLKVRQGKLLGRENYRVESLNEDDELLAEFMAAYYEDSRQLPPRIYVPTTAQQEFIERWLSEAMKVDTKIIVPGDNDKKDIAALNMARENAHEDIIRRLRDRGDTPAMEELKNLLGLDTLPIRIEGFDIAHIGGKFPVASLISFYNGNPDKKNYRYFRLKNTDGIIDDFESMREATTRRYTRLLNEQADLPDLIMIDGGIGQVNAVENVLNSLNLDIPIVGLAEKNEDLYLPGNSTPIRLPRRSDGLRLLQRVRDECHRFATSRNQNLRTKENTQTIFLELPGVGEKRAAALQKTFITIEGLATAQESAIAQCLHIKASEAADILFAAKQLLAKREDKKALQRHSLGKAGTTKEKAAEADYIAGLAAQALGLSVADSTANNTKTE
nr:excinuclease ABC subunit UvrC [Treponema sp.]